MDKKGRVLIVEGDPTITPSLADPVRPFASAVCVTSIADAIKELDADRVDVILCDWFLPDGEALPVLRRAQAKAPNATFVAVASRMWLEKVKNEPALAGYKVIAADSSKDIIAMLAQQGVAVSRMRDSTRMRSPLTR